MTNINQLSSLINNVSQETIKTNNKVNTTDFLSLLKELKDKKTDEQITIPKFSGDVLNIHNNSNSSTESFLSNMGVNKKDNNAFYNAVDIVNNAQLKADKSSAEFAAGYGDELQVALDVSKAEQYLQFFSEVRVKFVNAFKELSRTQI